MQGEEVTDIPATLPAAEFLTAEELVSLRRRAEETAQPVIGEKLYTRTDSLLEEKSLKSALESFKDSLDKKRASKLCDLMQAEWNSESNTVTASKLKGKFTQHMGRLIDGKHVLSPEEAVFLLENNCIEILHNKIPMSTEEAFSMILKGNLGLEKYEVYSHFSKLGYIVVRHQTEACVTEYEKEMNLHKYPVQKRHLTEPAEGEPEKKRLTFTGALSGDTSKENSANVTESENFVCPDTPMEETSMLEGSEQIISEKNVDNVTNMQPNMDEQNDSGVLIDNIMEDTQHNIDMTNHTSMNDAVLEARFKNNDSEISKETNATHDSMSFEENGSVGEMEKNTNTIGVDSQNFNDLAENNTLQNSLSLQNTENHDFLDSNSQSSKFVDVMDVDTDAETSRSTSEVSRDNFDSNLNVISQDSCVSVNNDDNHDANHDSNSDVLSMSDSSMIDEEEVLTIDAASADNPSKEDDDDDEVTLIEVTKKETKPLAVIDLSSDDDDDDEEEEEEAAEDVDVVDDDVTFLEEYPSPSTSKPTSSRDINSKKLNGCKKEEAGAVVSRSKLIPPLTIQFPDLFKKRVVCVARPPFHLLPSNVKPSKEAYVLNLKPKNAPIFNNRVWNSYFDMQDYQRQRRQNRHQNNIPRDQPFSGPQALQDRNSRSYERTHRLGFGSDRVDSPDINSNSRSRAPLQLDFNRNLFSANSFQNNFPSPSLSSTNREVTVNEDANESMVSSSQSSHSNNFNFSSGIPNNPLMNPMIPVNPSNFMAGFQRNAYSASNVSHTHFMAELQRTCFTVATNVLSSMLNRNAPLLPTPPMSMFPPCHFNPSLSNGFSNSPSLPSSAEYYSMPHHTFGEPRRLNRGRPFPCRYRNVSNKQSWNDVRSAVCNSNSDDSDSDIEEMPLGPKEILWENRDICSLVKPGVRYPVVTVLKFVQITQKAKLTSKYGYSERFLPSASRLEISFDVYPPGFIYKKTRRQIPNYRVVVLKISDPFPKYLDIVLLQRIWNDGATLLLALNDNGDISFHSFNSVCVPSLTPHEKFSVPSLTSQEKFSVPSLTSQENFSVPSLTPQENFSVPSLTPREN